MRHPRIVAAAVLLVVLGACSSGSKSSTASGPTRVRLADFSIDMPNMIEGPIIDLSITNDGAMAHELAITPVKPGTTVQQVIDALSHGGERPSFVLPDPGGINLLGPHERLEYQRRLAPGSYVFWCGLPTHVGPDHAHRGMAHAVTVTDTGRLALPSADLTITLRDGRIDAPTITAGTHRIAITNHGTKPHELFIGGLPKNADFSRVDEVGAWMDGGQDGPPPLPVVFPGGHQDIGPGQTVVLTITFRAGYAYHLNDNTGDQPLSTVVEVR